MIETPLLLIRRLTAQTTLTVFLPSLEGFPMSLYQDQRFITQQQVITFTLTIIMADVPDAAACHNPQYAFQTSLKYTIAQEHFKLPAVLNAAIRRKGCQKSFIIWTSTRTRRGYLWPIPNLHPTCICPA